MRVLVVGASGGTGRAAIEALLAAGHEVTALVRRLDALGALASRVRLSQGDATEAATLESAVQGQDAVIVTLGIAENPLKVRLLGSRGTPMDVRSRGTGQIIEIMQRHGVRKLLVQTSYGVGETRSLLPLRYRWLFRLLLTEQIEDTERQETLVRASGLDWVLVQPVNLTDGPREDGIFASTEGQTQSMHVSRKQVARFLVGALDQPRYIGRSVALSS